MKKTKKLITGFVTLMSAVTLLSCTVPYLSKSISKKDQYTVISDDGYSETTYYKTREAYNDYLKSLNKTSSKAKSTAKYVDNLQKNEKFVIAASKQVEVEEIVDDQGNVIASAPAPVGNRDSMNTTIDNQDGGGGSDSGNGNGNGDRSGDNGSNKSDIYEVGTNTRSVYYLNISLVVFFNTKTYKYEVETNSGWNEPDNSIFVEAEQKAEHNSFDFIGITWGGNGKLHGEISAVSAYYNDSSAVQFPFYEEDNFNGYIWGFKERSKMFGDRLTNAKMKVKIEKPTMPFAERTNIKMTYVHTYSKIEGSATLSASMDGFAAGITLSYTGDQWRQGITVDIDY